MGGIHYMGFLGKWGGYIHGAWLSLPIHPQMFAIYFKCHLVAMAAGRANSFFRMVTLSFLYSHLTDASVVSDYVHQCTCTWLYVLPIIIPAWVNVRQLNKYKQLRLLHSLQLLLPDGVRFSCCSPIASTSADCVCFSCCSPILATCGHAHAVQSIVGTKVTHH